MTPQHELLAHLKTLKKWRKKGKLRAKNKLVILQRLGEAARVGRCVCKEGYTRVPDNYACKREGEGGGRPRPRGSSQDASLTMLCGSEQIQTDWLNNSSVQQEKDPRVLELL